MVTYASRITSLPPYLFAEVDRAKQQKIREGVDVIDLGVGDPDTPTPDYVVESLCKAVHKPETHQYPSYSGSNVFRDAAAQWCAERFGVKLDPASEVITLIGSKEGIAHIPLAFVNPGDYTLCPNPAYPVYAIGTTLADGTPYDMPLLAENGFRPDLSAVPKDIVKKAKMLFINYPNNPTAAIADKKYLREAVDFGRDNGIVVVSDNAYSEIAYDGYKAPSILEIPGAMDCCVEFHSLEQDVQHDRLAHRLHCRQQGHRRRPGQGEDERRLRRIPGRAARGHRGAEPVEGLPPGAQQDVPGPQGRALRRAEGHGPESDAAESHVLRLGAHTGEVHVHRVREIPAGYGRHRRHAGRRLRQVRRRLHPLLADQPHRTHPDRRREDETAMMPFEIPGHLDVKHGHLHIGGVDTVDLAAEYGTPLYVTNEDRLRANYRRFAAAFPEAHIFFAAKSNNNIVVQKILAQEGAGADAFSDGEIFLARLAGIPANKILFTGNSKTDAELQYAVDAGTMVSVDSHDELIALSRISSAAGKEIKIAFRVNPDVDARRTRNSPPGWQSQSSASPESRSSASTGKRRTCPG